MDTYAIEKLLNSFTMHISKDQILSKVSTWDILEYFLREHYAKAQLPMRPGVHIHVPEISGDQKSPSFNIYHSRRSGEYRYKDWIGNDGSAFDLVMNMYNVSFIESLKIINTEMRLGLDVEAVKYQVSKPKPKKEIVVQAERNYEYTLEIDKWQKKHLEFWSYYGTGVKTLEKYNVKPIKSFSAFKKDNTPYEFQSRLNGLIFAYMNNGWCKLYIPEIIGVQKKSFMYLGRKPNDFVFGLKQLPERGTDCYLIGGEKDVVNMHSHGKHAVCLTSEESTPGNYPKFMELIKSDRFENYYITLDNDETGRRQMVRINREFPELKIKNLDIKDGYDLSDYLKDKYNKLMF